MLGVSVAEVLRREGEPDALPRLRGEYVTLKGLGSSALNLREENSSKACWFWKPGKREEEMVELGERVVELV